MGPELIDNRHVELSATARDVGTAWLLAAVIVTVLMTVVAPFFSA
jgi:hypothetical protein